jgi:hypothetical protein
VSSINLQSFAFFHLLSSLTRHANVNPTAAAAAIREQKNDELSEDKSK